MNERKLSPNIPPADEQPGSVEVSERDKEVAANLVDQLYTDLNGDLEVQIIAKALAAYRHEIEGNAPTTA